MVNEERLKREEQERKKYDYENYLLDEIEKARELILEALEQLLEDLKEDEKGFI